MSASLIESTRAICIGDTPLQQRCRELADTLESTLEQLEATRSALQALVDYADGKVGDDFGTTEWARAREALKDA